jgi:ABC-type antimicrobial peptide transport system ATPase subunit
MEQDLQFYFCFSSKEIKMIWQSEKCSINDQMQLKLVLDCSLINLELYESEKKE